MFMCDAMTKKGDIPCQNQAKAGTTKTPASITEPYRLHAKLPVFNRRVGKALDFLNDKLSSERAYVAFSGGKDSMVCLHLANQIRPTTGVFFDSGAETPATWAVIEQAKEMFDIVIIPAEIDIVTMCRMAGFWDSDSPTGDFVTWYQHEWKDNLIGIPSRRYRESNNIEITITGIRKTESYGRHMHVISRGIDYTLKSGERMLMPVGHWEGRDILAYIFKHNLPVSDIYLIESDSMERRERRRTGTMLGSTSANFGRFVELRQQHPDLWQHLLTIFPGLSEYG